MANSKWNNRHGAISEAFDYVMLANMALWLVAIVLWVWQEIAWRKAHDVTA